MDRDEFKQIILNLPDNSPKLLEYLKEAKEKGWKDIVDMIAIKLGLKEEKKKGKKEESEVLRKILKPLGKKKIEHTWDYEAGSLALQGGVAHQDRDKRIRTETQNSRKNR